MRRLVAPAWLPPTGVLERRWALAGAATLLAGLTRSSAVVLTAAVVLSVVGALRLSVAVGLADRRPGTRVAVVAGYVAAGSWLSGYGLTVWPYAI